MPPLIYPEESNHEEYPSDPPSTNPTLDHVPPSQKPTREQTSEPDYDALSERFAPTREGSKGCLAPKYILRYHNGPDPPIFSILEERTKEAPWGYTC